MEKGNFSQLELFSQGKDSSLSKSELPGALRGYLRHFEKTVLAIIVFLITAVVAFCLGVEKGKKVTGFKGNLQFDTAVNRQEFKTAPVSPVPVMTGNVVSDKAKSSTVTPAESVAPINKDNGGFTVQVATYATRSSAQNEIGKLKKRGFAPVIVSKGGYNIICVGSFTKKEMAKSLLSKLRQNYRDCYIRRL